MAYKYNDKIKQKKREYYLKHKEKILERTRKYSKKWYLENIERIRNQHRQYYNNNLERESERHRVIYQNNKEKILNKSREYYWKNTEKIRDRHRKYNDSKRKTILQYKRLWQKERRVTNPQWRLNENIGSAMARSLKGIKSGKPWQKSVDYTLENLIRHLENQFNSKMDWKNYGTYWAVDHIKPKSLFSYTSAEDKEFKECWSLKNLQPLEKIENIKKGNRYINN